MGKLVAVSYSSNGAFYSAGVHARAMVQLAELVYPLLPVTFFRNVVPMDLNDHFVRLQYRGAHLKD